MQGTDRELLLCSLCRQTTPCLKRPPPPSPISPTGAPNKKRSSLDHCQTTPGLWESLPSCLQGTVFVGGIWGMDRDGLENVTACECISVCVYRYVCVGGGKMCNLRLVMCPQRQSSTAFVLRIPLEGILPAWLEGNWRLSGALNIQEAPLPCQVLLPEERGRAEVFRSKGSNAKS